MSQRAHEYVEAFRRGEDFKPPSQGLIVQGQPDQGAVEILGRELLVAPPGARENIVDLLVELGRRTDSLTPRGADAVRHPFILAMLAGPGLAKADIGQQAAMDALRKLATRQDLSRFPEKILKALEDSPSDSAFLLVAKAKPAGASTVVEKLALEPKWKNAESVKIARAALGVQSIEDEYLVELNQAEGAMDGKTMAHVIGTLGLIGTHRSLVTVAERLRSPVTILVPGSSERSVRISVLEALLYNYPDEPVLYPNNVNSDADYESAERFCESTLGVKYSKPRPPYMKYRAFPIPAPR